MRVTVFSRFRLVSKKIQMKKKVAAALTRVVGLEKQDPEEIFVLKGRKGTGAFGAVFQAAYKTPPHDTVAIKIIQLALPGQAGEEIENVEKEIQFLRECDHPNVTKFHGAYYKEGSLWIVMEYCGGGSVGDIARYRPLGGPEIAIIMREALHGLAYLHSKKKIHRDIKGGNILLTEKGHVKIADFGVSAQLRDTMSRRGTFVGTPYWMSPEMIQDSEYDYKADVWSLGITAIELAEQKPPLFDEHPMRVLLRIPRNPPPTLKSSSWDETFTSFISFCLTKDPAARPTALQCLQHEFITSSLAYAGVKADGTLLPVSTPGQNIDMEDSLIITEEQVESCNESVVEDVHATLEVEGPIEELIVPYDSESVQSLESDKISDDMEESIPYIPSSPSSEDEKEVEVDDVDLNLSIMLEESVQLSEECTPSPIKVANMETSSMCKKESHEKKIMENSPMKPLSIKTSPIKNLSMKQVSMEHSPIKLSFIKASPVKPTLSMNQTMGNSPMKQLSSPIKQLAQLDVTQLAALRNIIKSKNENVLEYVHDNDAEYQVKADQDTSPFGKSLVNVIPPFLLHLQTEMYKVIGCQAEGIFRCQAETESSVDEKMNDICSGTFPTVDETKDPHVYAALIKRFFSELPSSLLHAVSSSGLARLRVLQSSFTKTASSQELKLGNQEIQDVLFGLSSTEKLVLNWLPDLFLDVLNFTQLNLMTIHSLSIVIAPVLVSTPAQCTEEAFISHTQLAYEATKTLLMWRRKSTAPMESPMSPVATAVAPLACPLQIINIEQEQKSKAGILLLNTRVDEHLTNLAQSASRMARKNPSTVTLVQYSTYPTEWKKAAFVFYQEMVLDTIEGFGNTSEAAWAENTKSVACSSSNGLPAANVAALGLPVALASQAGRWINAALCQNAFGTLVEETMETVIDLEQVNIHKIQVKKGF